MNLGDMELYEPVAFPAQRLSHVAFLGPPNPVGPAWALLVQVGVTVHSETAFTEQL